MPIEIARTQLRVISLCLQLRILWCQSPYATAELFDELKVSLVYFHSFPDVLEAVGIPLGRLMLLSLSLHVVLASTLFLQESLLTSLWL